jgi:hypothetical protein
MDLQFRFRESALKHGVTEADIRHAFENYRFTGPYHDRGNEYLLVGFDTKVNPIEILYNEFGANGVNIYHAMKCRSQFLRLFEQGEMS